MATMLALNVACGEPAGRLAELPVGPLLNG